MSEHDNDAVAPSLRIQKLMHTLDTARNVALASIAAGLGSLESVIWDCDDHTAFEAIDDATVIANQTNHVSGTSAVKWTKAGTSINSGVKDTFTAVDLSAYGPNDYLLVCVNVTSVAKIASLIVRLGTDASNYTQFQFNDSAMTTGWNLLKIKLSDLTSVTGTGLQPASITYGEVYFIFDAGADQLADITLDHVAFASAEAVTTNLADLESLITASNAYLNTLAAATLGTNLTAAGIGTTIDVPLAGETAEDATARTIISLLKRSVNKLIDNKAFLDTLTGRSGITGAKGLVLHPCDGIGGFLADYDCINRDDDYDHMTGDASASWDKEGAGAMIMSGMHQQFADEDEIDITDYVADDYFAVTFQCPNVSELDYVRLRVGSGSTSFWEYRWSPDTCAIIEDEWTTLYVKLADLTAAASRVWTEKIKYFQFLFVMDAVDDTFTDAKLDSIRIVSAEAAYAATNGFAPTAGNGLIAVETADAEWTSITLTPGATGAYWSLSGSSAYVVCQTATPADADTGAIFFPNIPYFWKTRGRTKIWIRRTATAQAKIHVTDEQ